MSNAAEDLQIAAAVTAAIDAMRKVFGQGTNRQWSLAAFTILNHVMRIVLLDRVNFKENRASYEERLVELWQEMKDKGETVQ